MSNIFFKLIHGLTTKKNGKHDLLLLLKFSILELTWGVKLLRTARLRFPNKLFLRKKFHISSSLLLLLDWIMIFSQRDKWIKSVMCWLKSFHCMCAICGHLLPRWPSRVDWGSTTAAVKYWSTWKVWISSTQAPSLLSDLSSGAYSLCQKISSFFFSYSTRCIYLFSTNFDINITWNDRNLAVMLNLLCLKKKYKF